MQQSAYATRMGLSASTGRVYEIKETTRAAEGKGAYCELRISDWMGIADWELQIAFAAVRFMATKSQFAIRNPLFALALPSLLLLLRTLAVGASDNGSKTQLVFSRSDEGTGHGVLQQNTS